MEAIRGIAEEEWGPLRSEDGIVTDREVAETVHSTNQGTIVFRLVVMRWRDRQGNLFCDTYHYHCIATNMVEESVQEVV